MIITCVFICSLLHSGCSRSQGLRIIFSDASRLIFRLSSSSGVRATLRLYAESYERDPSGHDQEPQVQKQLCSQQCVSQLLANLAPWGFNGAILPSGKVGDNFSWRTSSVQLQASLIHSL